jgi:hypothetical protein
MRDRQNNVIKSLKFLREKPLGNLFSQMEGRTEIRG